MQNSSKALRRLVAAAGVAAVAVGSAAAASAVTKRTIEAEYAGIKLMVDGVEVTPKDAAGNAVEPFISNGTTYLPVRAVGNALGKEVEWDGNTKTVYIGSHGTARLPYQVNSNAALYDGSKADESFSVAGTAHNMGVVLKSVWKTGNSDESRKTADAIWNTEGFKTMTFTVGHVGNVQANGTLYVALDGLAAGEYQLRWDGSPQTITVNLDGSPNVKLSLVADPLAEDVRFDSATWPNQLAEYGIYDVTLS